MRRSSTNVARKHHLLPAITQRFAGKLNIDEGSSDRAFRVYQRQVEPVDHFQLTLQMLVAHDRGTFKEVSFSAS